MDKDIAIKADNISKSFIIPHEKISTLRGAFVNLFKSKTYEKFNALDNVTFEVKKGEFLGIIGRNGSGKSTLLKILAGIYKPDSGRVEINGLISPFLELGIGFNPELSGRDNIYLNATVLGLSEKQIDEKFEEIVDFSELRRFIDQKVKNYSSGMQVRLAFSVAIHARRDILLMDEVLAVGDANFQKKCINEFEKYKYKGKTIILVTHDVDIVRNYCDRALLLSNGRMVEIGNTEKVIDKYRYLNLTDEEKRLRKEYEKINQKIETDNKSEVVEKNNQDVEQKEEKLEKIKEDNEWNFYQRSGNKKAIIESYKIFNDKNAEALNIETGSKFKVVLRVKFLEKSKNPVFGFILRKNPHENLYAVHSLFNRKPVSINEAKKGEIIEYTCEDTMPLNPDSYYVSFACAGEEMKGKYDTHDFLSNVMKINVFSRDKFWATIDSMPSMKIIKIAK